MYQANNPNFYCGSDSEKIEQALAFAAKNSLPLEITRRCADDDRDFWLIERAILLMADSVLNIVDCTIQLADSCRDNFIRSGNCIVGSKKVEPIENITICGIGNAVLKGADIPRSTGDSAKILGERTFGTDAGKTGENPNGDWRNIGILLADVSNFSISNIKIIDQHCWGISLEYCRHGSLKNIVFDARNSKEINGSKVTILNQDGIDLRQGCCYIDIENISGNTGDDMVALTGIGPLTENSVPGGRSTHFSASVRRGDNDNIHHINIKNVRGMCYGKHHIVRLLNTRGVKMHHIDIDGIYDESPAEYATYATLKIGDRNPNWGGTNPVGDTAFVTVKNVISNSQCGIAIQNSLSDSVFSNIGRGANCGDLLKVFNTNIVKNVQFEDLKF